MERHAAIIIQKFWRKYREYLPKMECCQDCSIDAYLLYNDICEKNLCADCFWEFEDKIKKRNRANQAWRYNRAYSAAIVIFNKTEEEAKQIAESACQNPTAPLPFEE